MNGNVVTVFLLFALILSLAGNAYLFLRYKEQIGLTDEVMEHLERARKALDDREKTITAIHEMYQKELGKQREMFAKYYGRKREDGECGD